MKRVIMRFAQFPVTPSVLGSNAFLATVKCITVLFQPSLWPLLFSDLQSYSCMVSLATCRPFPPATIDRLPYRSQHTFITRGKFTVCLKRDCFPHIHFHILRRQFLVSFICKRRCIGKVQNGCVLSAVPLMHMMKRTLAVSGVRSLGSGWG